MSPGNPEHAPDIPSIDRILIEAYFRSNEATKLHIGCGDRQLGGWLNSDSAPRTSSILRLDAARRFPFGNDMFDYVFSEHMIEHIGFYEGLKMLSETHRVLKPGGTLRLSTPDLRFLFELYRKERSPLQQAYIEWSSSQYLGAATSNPVPVINNFMRAWGHTFIYDEKTLSISLLRAGFKDIKRRRIGQSEHPALRNLELVSRLPDGFLELESMIFEATKD